MLTTAIFTVGLSIIMVGAVALTSTYLQSSSEHRLTRDGPAHNQHGGQYFKDPRAPTGAK